MLVWTQKVTTDSIKNMHQRPEGCPYFSPKAIWETSSSGWANQRQNRVGHHSRNNNFSPWSLIKLKAVQIRSPADRSVHLYLQPVSSFKQTEINKYHKEDTKNNAKLKTEALSYMHLKLSPNFKKQRMTGIRGGLWHLCNTGVKDVSHLDWMSALCLATNDCGCG